ncbi:Putative calcium-binding protein CML19 [Linum perenne]
MVNVMVKNAPAALDFERVFRHLDEDGDGKISPSELNHHLGLGLTREEEELCLLSVSDDGMLGLDDLVELIEAGEEEDKLRDLKEAFQMYDGENCGFITPGSLRAMLARLGESKSMEECGSMISRFDLDGDGVLSFDEFRVMML